MESREPVSCPLCPTFKAPNPGLLWPLIRLVHATKPWFFMRCKIDNCSRTFTTMKTYDNHISRDHFMCSRTTMPELCLSDSSEGASVNNTGFSEDSCLCDEPDTQETDTRTMEEDLKSAAAHWILKIRETCKLTQSAMDDIIQGATNFNSYILTTLSGVVKTALEDLGINMKDVPQLVKAFDVDGPFFRPFRGVETYHQHLQYCKNNLGLVVRGLISII